jgi:hypothetical protein
MKRRAVPKTEVLLFCVLAGVAGCKQQETRESPQQVQVERSRLEALERAEAARAAQQAAEAAGRAGAQTPGGQAATSGGTPGAAAQGAPQPYLPPSEQGAYVEMTETPAGSAPPAPAAAAAGAEAPPGGGPGAAGGPASGADAGGNMPSAAPNPALGGSGAQTPPPGTGAARTAPGTLPAVQGAAAPVRPGVDQVQALNGELERKLREFDELMKRAQLEAEKERAAIAAGGGSREGGDGRRRGRPDAPPDDFGAGGAAEESSGLGASPDLSGETGRIDEEFRGRSPSRVEGAEDDDIVARQLREAAERETDPVLREKLWAEYRNYKGL